MTPGTAALRAGVIGVGSMGRHHARVYRELPDIELTGVSDIDPDRAEAIADQYRTTAHERDALLDTVDLVSIAVPTDQHYEVARSAIEHGVHLLVEKPFVSDRDEGIELVGRARAAGLTLQVGHIERFNPAIGALDGLLSDLDIIAITASRLGPPLDRYVGDDVVMDLMIHDLDVLLSIVDADIDRIGASSTHDDQYATTTIDFDSGLIGSLTASRVTQQKVRELSITAQECRVNVDYAAQSVRVHRHSAPSYVEDDGDVRYRHASVVEQPSVDNGEPLKREIDSFVDAVREGDPAVVDGEDGLRAVALAQRIRSVADRSQRHRREVVVE